jgi:hypothetical protein
MMTTLLADAIHVSGDSSGLVHSLLFVLVVGICILAIWWVGNYFIGTLSAPPVASKIWNGLFVLLGLFVVVNFLMGLTGRPLVEW